MFTGIISTMGTLLQGQNVNGVYRVRIACDYAADSIKLGESIACNGVCLTVVNIGKENETAYFEAELSPETLARTAPRWSGMQYINLERALKAGDDISGHFVTGHVDGLVTIENIDSDQQCYNFTLSVPDSLARFVAPKGSVALDGVSLTVNEVEGNRFTVMIIPHTFAHTTLGLRKKGEMLNMEVDMMARYIDRMLQARGA